ncbi:hypothetical protein [Sphingomonas colocasiae]|uniref:Uncharacterized protein n=1 Tax=Sphingomonas colocasiae TaxID=1848973 RepID=A0ABS7PXI8_9SPHN|nr:hypothetical protein [Sphingomonas colocasiae]MBY8825062.1 hypothetical protein [Sphingomonas colocasiae]
MHLMFGFHDHVVDKHSGRPKPHESWQVERFTTWTAWAMAAVSAIGAAAYFRTWHALDGTMAMLGGAMLFAFIAYVRQAMLDRKRRALREAIAAYEAALARLRD